MPNWKVFKWTRDTKLNGFISTHHAPYNDKYRYWSGLLLLVRVTLYMTSAVTLSSNPQIPLLVTIILVGGIFFLKGLMGIAVNKKLYAEFIETAMYLNLLCYAAFTLYNFKNDSTKQAVVAYTSTIITLILFIGAVLHHVIQLVKSRSKFNTKEAPTGGINQVKERGEITFSVMGISNSQNPSPEPCICLNELAHLESIS